MSPKTQAKLIRRALLPLTAILLLASGCSSSTTTNGMQSSGGPVFIVGTDAPSSIPSIVGVPIQIETIVLTNGPTMSNNLLAVATTVDFARYNGLQGFVDMNDVQPGTYTGVTITLGTASINYLSPGTPPTINNETATLSTSSVSITLPHSLTVSQTGGMPVGLRIDLDLRQSIETSGGVPTGTIDPTFDVSAVARTDTWAHIDEFIGSVTTLPSTSGTPPTAAEPNSFVITGPHGEAFTINTTSSTEWDGGATLASLNSTSIVAVAGQFDPADQTLDADEVALISDTGFYASGLVTYVTPTSGQATNMQFYVRGVCRLGSPRFRWAVSPRSASPATKTTASTGCTMPSPSCSLTPCALTPGQEITVGGPDPTAEAPFDVKRIHLQNWGYIGAIVAGSENSGANVVGTNGTFTMKVNGFAGQVIPSNVTVYLGPQCDFRYGLGSFTDLANATRFASWASCSRINPTVIWCCWLVTWTGSPSPT